MFSGRGEDKCNFLRGLRSLRGFSSLANGQSQRGKINAKAQGRKESAIRVPQASSPAPFHRGALPSRHSLRSLRGSFLHAALRSLRPLRFVHPPRKRQVEFDTRGFSGEEVSRRAGDFVAATIASDAADCHRLLASVCDLGDAEDSVHVTSHVC